MDTARVVEVLHDRGVDVSPRWLLGSGFILRKSVVITAAHNLGEGTDEAAQGSTFVRLMDGSEKEISTVLAVNRQIDLAVLTVEGLGDLAPVSLAQVDRTKISVLTDVMAVGFPNYKYEKDKPPAKKRQPAQPVGVVPTAENAKSAHLVLKISGGEPAPPEPGDGSPWAGLSGAAVFYGETLLGVAVEHHTSEGLGTLHFVPFTEIFALPFDQQMGLAAAIGIPDVTALPMISSPVALDQMDPDLEQLLREIRTYEKNGLLAASAAKSLTVAAFKKAKGW